MTDLLTLTRDPRLAPQATSAVAALLWASDATRILWANAAGAALMDAPTVPDLLARRFSDDDDVPARIARLAQTLPQTGAPRLEQLYGLMCICSRLPLGDGSPAIFVLASEAVKPALPLPERVARLIADAPIAAFAPEGMLLHAPDAIKREIGEAATLAALDLDALARTAREAGRAEGDSRIGHVVLERIGSASSIVLLASFAFDAVAQPASTEVAQTAVVENAPDVALDAVAAELHALTPAPAAPEPAEAPAEPQVPAPSLPPERRHPLRFVWQMDAETRFTLTSPEFTHAAGAATAAVLGKPWAEVAQHLALDPDGRITRAVASRDTWSGIVVAWPIEGDATIDVELSGLPVFDRDRSFRGYRGFGVCRDMARLAAARATRREAAATPAETAPVETAPADEGAVDAVEAAVETAAEPAEIKAEPPAEARPLLTVVPAAKNVVPFRGAPDKRPALTPVERTAFNEIAETLGGRVEPDKRTEEKAPSEHTPSPKAIPPGDALPSAFAIGEAAEAPAATASTGAEKVLDRLPVAVLIHRDEQPIYANRTFLEWTGFADIAALTAAGGLERLIVDPSGALDKATGTGKTFSVATRGGDTLSAEGRLYTVPWGAESAFMLVLVRTAADDRLRASQHALHMAETEARELKSILDTATDGIVVVDRDGRVLTLNRSAEALFGYEAREVLLRPFTELFAPESERAARDYLDGLTRNGVASVLNDGREVIGRVRQGGLIPLFMTMGRISETKLCAVFRDITQWKRAEEDLLNAKRHAERASSAKSDFLAKISHEIRTPLNAIIGFSEVMMEEQFGAIGNERYREYLKDIHTSGGHLVSLINDLLDLSKIEAGKLDLSFASVNLNELIRQCVALMQPQANRERIIIRSSLSPALPPVVADARSVKQIVLNLLSNSIKFTGAGGQVIISSAMTERGEAVMRVRDTGIGMSEKEIETAMEPFRQLATSTRWGSGGTGLGLPLTKALAEANRASFAIKSAVNAGTLVEITFPATRVLAE